MSGIPIACVPTTSASSSSSAFSHDHTHNHPYHPHQPPTRFASRPSSASSSSSSAAPDPSAPSASRSAAAPMAIRRLHDAVPPPLPPPSYLPQLVAGHDPGWKWGNDPSRSDFGKNASVKPGSSLLGAAAFRNGAGYDEQRNRFSSSYASSSQSSYLPASSDHARRGFRSHDTDLDPPDAGCTSSDEDVALSRPQSNYRLHSEQQLGQRTLEESSCTYDKHLLSKIGRPTAGFGTPKRTSISLGVQDGAQLSHTEAERRTSQLRPLSVPDRRQQSSSSSLDSPAHSRWPSSSGANSPALVALHSEHGPYDRYGRTLSQSLDDAVPQRGSYDHSAFLREDIPEDEPMSNLHIHDRSPVAGFLDELPTAATTRAGTKRRASSPPRDGLPEERSTLGALSGQGEMFHRRPTQHLPTATSPGSRFPASHSPLSSASSSVARHGSLASSLGVPSVSTSFTSYASGRHSPGALSPAFETAGAGSLSSSSSLVANASQRRTVTDSTSSSGTTFSADIASSLDHAGGPQSRASYICECCPKKPKRFDTEEDLRLHECEKQYTCAYCPNRFKNKNEAERHQNSLHLRRHSWSCAALAGVEAAFHASVPANGNDVCGYCGKEFPNPPRWDVRSDHLHRMHKFGDCNLAKKFFRADHFRQHLKHSHAGTSGKWTNMLETACMKDEPGNDPLAPPMPPALILSAPGSCASPHRDLPTEEV